MTFTEWFQEHVDEIYDMELEELAWACWSAGYQEGLDSMGNFAHDLIRDVFIDKPKSSV